MDLAAIEQGSREWLQARSKRITASDFGSACKHNPYKSAVRLMKDKVWPQPDKGPRHAMDWGTKHEDYACLLYEVYHREVLRTAGFEIQHAGLLVPPPPLDVVGLSPDGFVREQDEHGQMRYGLLEIKCPCSPINNAPIRHYYYDQIQGICEFMRDMAPEVLSRWPAPTYCDFVVYSPSSDELQITRYPVDVEYGAQLRKAVLRFGRTLRDNLARKARGELKQGQVIMP
jgi:hypothetical protein